MGGGLSVTGEEQSGYSLPIKKLKTNDLIIIDLTKMKLIQSTLERSFTVRHREKTYYVSYLNSDGQILGSSNRDYWEVYNEEFEELPNHNFKGNKVIVNKKELKLKIELTNFCIKHFNDYKPNYKDDC